MSKFLELAGKEVSIMKALYIAAAVEEIKANVLRTTPSQAAMLWQIEGRAAELRAQDEGRG